MITYWLSKTGESAAEGPFTDAQLLNMWHSGSATAKAMICEEGSQDWTPLIEHVEQAADFQRKEDAIKHRRQQMQNHARQQFEERKKSPGLALALSALLPFGGQIYCRAWKQIFLAVGFLAIFAFAALSSLVAAGWIVWAAMMADAVIGAKAYNKKLAAELGLVI